MKKPTILISGMLAGVPYQGGASWAVLQYVLGFRRLGYPVLFFEPLDAAMIQPQGQPLEQCLNAAYFLQLVDEFQLEETAALVRFDRRQSVGLPFEQVQRALRHADILINLAGTLPLRFGADDIPTRVYLDLDPLFTQIWQLNGEDMGLQGHTHYLSVGLALGAPDCAVPNLGLDWQTTLQPVVMDLWPAQHGEGFGFSTVANWRSYGPVEYCGKRYGQKAHSWRRLLDLPGRTGTDFEVALSIHRSEESDLDKLRSHGWRLSDPRAVAATPGAYRRYIQTSRAELAVAKQGYVDSRSGWFSERSACYLASARPVAAQSTGFEEHLPCGKGLLAFSSMDEAVEAVSDIQHHYPDHARAARRIAEEYFDSNCVLPGLLRCVGAL